VAINPDFSDLFAALNAAGARYLIANKRATGRPQDLLDAEVLERSARSD
jgi:hypothetical protein